MKKVLFFLMTIAMFLAVIISCGGGDNETPNTPLSPDETKTELDIICATYNINSNNYEWITSERDSDNKQIKLAGYKNGTDELHIWWINTSTNEIREYKGIMKRSMDFDLGYVKHATMNVDLKESNVRDELEIDGIHIFRIKCTYHTDNTTGDRAFVQRVIFMTPNASYAIKDRVYNETGDLTILKWFNNSVAISNVPENTYTSDSSVPSTTIHSNIGEQITSFFYDIAKYRDSEVLELTDYDKCIKYKVVRDLNNDLSITEKIVFDFIDFSKSTVVRRDVAVSAAQVVLTPKISGNDDSTKYSVEILESNTNYCKARMNLLEYNGEKKSYVFKITKTGKQAVELVE